MPGSFFFSNTASSFFLRFLPIIPLILVKILSATQAGVLIRTGLRTANAEIRPENQKIEFNRLLYKDMKSTIYHLMKNFYKHGFPAILSLLILSGVLAGCNLNGSYKESSTGGVLSVIMHDSPGPYDAVILSVQKVEAQAAGSNSWISLNSQAFQVDLTQLINGQYVIIGQAKVDTTTYTKLRLVLGTGGKVQVDDTTSDLKIADDARSDITLDINAAVTGEQSALVAVDFDVSRSVIKSGSGSSAVYTLNPVVSAKDLTETGAVSGTIQPATARAVIYAIAGADTVSSTYSVEDPSIFPAGQQVQAGDFELLALDGGPYNLIIHPLLGNFKDTTLSNIRVVTQQKTQIGTITLDPKPQ